MATEIKDSGERTVYETGAVREKKTGKGRMDLLPPSALIEVSKVFEIGGTQKGDRNWEKGIPLSSFLDSGLRHIMRWSRGDNDEPHLAQALWNLLCLQETVIEIEAGRLPSSLQDLPRAPVKIPVPF